MCANRAVSFAPIYRIDTSDSVPNRALPFPLDRALSVAPTSLLCRIAFYPNPYVFSSALSRKSGFVADLRSDMVNKSDRENVWWYK